MNIYTVLLSKTKSAKVEIEAESAQEAENIAFEQFMDCKIELEDSGIPGDVDIYVSENKLQRDAISDYGNHKLNRRADD